MRSLNISSRYRLSFSELSSASPDIIISVVKFSAAEAVSQIFRYEIEFTSPTVDIPASQIINYPATFTMIPDGQFLSLDEIPRIVSGVITAFRQENTSADETRYRAVLEHRLALLNQGRNYAIFLNDSVTTLGENTLRAWGMDRLDYRFSLSDEYPSRDFMMQYDESDYRHLARRLADSGIAYYLDYDAENKSDVIVLADNPGAWKEGPTLPVREPSELSDAGSESVWDISVSRHAIPKFVQVNDDNDQRAQSDMGAIKETTRDYPALSATDYRWAEHYPEPGQEHDETPGQGGWYARRRQERYLSERIVFDGKSNCMALRPGMMITAQGTSWTEASGGLLIIETRVENAGRDTSYLVAFRAIPWDSQFSYRPELLPWPVISGTLPARISSAQDGDTYAHLDEQGRYRVRFGLDLKEWKKGQESAWLRMARPYSGDTYGLHFPLLDGTDVAIAFMGGDPDRPYIAHGLHDSRHPDLVTKLNYKRNVLRTPANNKLRMDDTRGQEHVKLSTDHSGKSQLNLGYLVDQNRKLRGEGAELRTDGHIAVRGGKGLFISADKQQGAAGEMLEMKQANALLSTALVQMKSLADSALHVQALAADIDRQQSLLQQKVDSLREAVLLASAPEGVALASGDDMQLSASDNITLIAGNQINLGSQKDLTLASGKQISLFSRQGAKLFASKGDIDIQALGGELTSWSTQDTHISSAKKITVTAQDELTLICGGAYVKIKGGNVEVGGPGNFIIRNQGIKKLSPSTMKSAPPPKMPTAHVYSAIYQLQDEQGNPLSNAPYRLSTAQGQTVAGYTDNEGRTVPVFTSQAEEVELHPVMEKPQPEETLYYIGMAEPLEMITELRENEQ